MAVAATSALLGGRGALRRIACPSHPGGGAQTPAARNPLIQSPAILPLQSELANPIAADPSAIVAEDYWSPVLDVPDNHAFVEVYGPMTPVPDHDGTMCFKYDDKLWSKADHFKVSPAPHGSRAAKCEAPRDLVPSPLPRPPPAPTS